jgi:hypothetical protein
MKRKPESYSISHLKKRRKGFNKNKTNKKALGKCKPKPQ